MDAATSSGQYAGSSRVTSRSRITVVAARSAASRQRQLAKGAACTRPHESSGYQGQRPWLVIAPAVFVLFSYVYCRSAPSLLGVGSEGRSSRYRMAGICLLGGATAIPPALFLMIQIVPDQTLVLLLAFIAFPLTFVSLFYVYRRRPLGRAGVGWVLILFVAGYVTLPVF